MNIHYYFLIGLSFLLSTVNLIGQTVSNDLPSIPREYSATKEIAKLSNKKIRIKPFKRILYFDIDEKEINTKSKGILNKLFVLLKNNEQLVVEITGHSNGSCDTQFCEDLSNERAESVAFYLMEKGLRPYRLQYNGFGKQKPIASNRTVDGRKKNQRVEIKVFSGN